jgi:hypothetical protein
LPPQAGGKAVKREDFNGAFNLLGGIAFMVQKGFTFKWSADQDYYAGCMVIDDTDGLRYECIADVTANSTAPSADSTHWQVFGGGTDIDIWFRQASTVYNSGAIALLLTLPTGWYLESTGTGGTTSASDLVIASPAIGDTVPDGTVVWTIRKVADTTDATTTTHGLMSASDKTKLNGIEANANNYSLPTASSSTLGGVKTGSNITNSSGTISLTKANVTSALGYTPPTTNTTYSTGTASTSGITKLYTGLGDNTDGTMTQKAIKAIVGIGGGIIAQNIAANGYIKFANGLIMQWGYYKGNSTSITYPITFPTECFIVRGETAGKSPDTVGSSYTGRLPSAYTKSGFTVAATPTYGVTWFAIGN